MPTRLTPTAVLIAMTALGTHARAQGVTISLSQPYAQLIPGQSLNLAATVSGTANSGVRWQVDNADGGTPATGTVSADGVFVWSRDEVTRVKLENFWRVGPGLTDGLVGCFRFSALRCLAKL